MRIIKVDAIDSTNRFVRDLYRSEKPDDEICVVARVQTAGKGQMGTSWQSNDGENLTCSIFLPLSDFMVENQFYIAMSTSLGIYDTLRVLQIPNISIKWPNDIMSYTYKVCGVLIENSIVSGRVEGAVIGIGLNVNQTEFSELPLARSLQQLTKKKYELDTILEVLLKKLSHRFGQLKSKDFKKIKNAYEAVLFRKNKPSTFLDVSGDTFTGIIQRVSTSGKLEVLLEDEVVKEFDLKEIKMLN